MDERKTITPNVGAYEGLKIAGGDSLSLGGVIRLIASYRGAEMLGIAGVVGLCYVVIAPVANMVVHMTGMLSILAVVVTGMLVTGRRNASAQAGTGETQADP